MTATADYMQALVLIRRLDRATRARLVAEVVQELATTPDVALQRSREAWATLAELHEEYRHLGSVVLSPSEQLELDRQQRADVLEGKIRE